MFLSVTKLRQPPYVLLPLPWVFGFWKAQPPLLSSNTIPWESNDPQGGSTHGVTHTHTHRACSWQGLPWVPPTSCGLQAELTALSADGARPTTVLGGTLTGDSGPEGHSVPPAPRGLPELSQGPGQGGRGSRGWRLRPGQAQTERQTNEQETCQTMATQTHRWRRDTKR